MKHSDKLVVADAMEELIRDRSKPSRLRGDDTHIAEHLDTILRRGGLAIGPAAKQDASERESWNTAFSAAISALDDMKRDAQPALAANGDAIALAVDIDDAIDAVKEAKDDGD